MLDLHPFGIRHLRHFLRLDLQHHTLVQNSDVLEIVQQGRGTRVGIARQEYRGARHTHRRPASQAGQK
jgi:hypothetical protein